MSEQQPEKRFWKTDSSDRLSLAVLAFCLLMLAGVLLFR